jgi:hypothetical protein
MQDTDIQDLIKAEEQRQPRCAYGYGQYFYK